MKRFSILAAAIGLALIIALVFASTADAAKRDRRRQPSTDVDTLTILLTMDATTPHKRPEHDAFKAAADYVYVLGQDLDFAHGYLCTNDADGNVNYNMLRTGLPTADTWERGTNTAEYMAVIRPDWADILPCDGRYTVLSAKVKGVHGTSASYTAPGDTFIVQPIAPEYTAWWQPTNLRVGNPLYGNSYGFSMWACASWDYQTTGLTGDTTAPHPYFNAPATPSDAWTNDGMVWDRSWVFDTQNALPDSCGRWNNCTGSTSYLGGNYVEWSFPVTLQYFLNGGTNNGLSYSLMCDGPSTRMFTLYNWERAGVTTSNLSPWIEVTLAKTPYRSTFPGGNEFCFIFQTDDQVKAANDAYTALAASMLGGKITVYVREDAVGNANRCTYADLLGYWQAGHEIGSHSRWHTDTQDIAHATGVWYGLSFWATTHPLTPTVYERGMALVPGDTLTNPLITHNDLLLADMDPVWLYDGLEAAGGDRTALEASLNVGRTIACPGNQWNPSVLEGAVYHNYIGIRVGQVANASRLDYRHQRRQTAGRGMTNDVTAVQNADTALVGFQSPHRNQARNLLLHPNSVSTTSFLGDEIADPTEAQVKYNLRRHIAVLLGRGNRVLSMFTHDFKATEGGAYLDGGVSADEFTWIMEVMQELDAEIGVWMPTTAEFQKWQQGRVNYMDTPADFGQDAAFEFDRADHVWGRPWRANYRTRN